MFKLSRLKKMAIGATMVATVFAATAFADHSWGPYHWARTANPLTLKLGNNLTTSAWLSALNGASTDWSESIVLNTSVVGGQGGKNCRPTAGRVEVCNRKYGNTGWLGIAQIWVTGGTHITQGVVKLNDTYHNAPPYNSAAWRQFVMCQEIGHQFGLDHQDENFDNANLGSCMDYTNDPDGGIGGATSTDPTNEHPNAHDFAQLVTIYGSHFDSSTTATSPKLGGAAPGGPDLPEAAEWGQTVRHAHDGRPSLYARDLGNGEKVFTFVYWADAK